MIRQLRVKGFRRYVDQTFTFGPGVTFIDGRNNAGKTTLFLAIEYALTGTVSGARSQFALLRPGAKGLGVELVFKARDGRTYKLQRIHQLPPRAKSRLVGHFTLKELVTREGAEEERYVLSSDFQDHEEVLARKLAELTGMSRRVFDLAVHIRQGEIAQILEGDARLDIALGMTAAGTVNEELRALALEDERAVETLPALEASLAHVEQARTSASTDEAGLTARREKLEAEQQALEARLEQPDGEDDEALEAFVEAVDGWRSAKEDLEREASDLEGPDAAALAVQVEACAAQVEAARARRPETELRYDLKARVRRREALLEKGLSSCESCGAALDAARARTELVDWKQQLAALEAGAVDEAALQATLAQRRAEHRARVSLEQTITESREAVVEAEKAARELLPTPDARDLEALQTEWETRVEQQRLARATEQARTEAKLEAVTQSLGELEARLGEERSRGGALDREHARLVAEVEGLRRCRRRAEELRTLSAAFKQLQEELRTRTATELAQSMHTIHRALSPDDEFEALSIDPARYQVLVTPRATGQELPASLSEGGGHRLLLGLAFRLALVKRLGPFPFVLLDEPTYGLDERHRTALLERIAGLGLCEQLLLITHQSMGDVQGPRIHVEQAA
jgi:DNA repair exonuclease SbcCD ATPase subunit